jgi:hypothetical protein
VLGWLSNGQTDAMFTSSLAQTFLYDMQYNHGAIVGGIGMISSPRVAYTRNDIISKFLMMKNYIGGKVQQPQVLVFLDADMVWNEDSIHRLILQVDREESPIVGGLAFAGRPETGCFSTTHRLVAEKDGTWKGGIELVAYHDLPENAMVKLGATGGACLAVHRNALSKMASSATFGLKNGKMNDAIWFEDRGGTWGEDVAFCLKAQACGIPIWVHTGIEFGHRKMITMGAEFWLDHKQVGEDPTRHGMGEAELL